MNSKSLIALFSTAYEILASGKFMRLEAGWSGNGENCENGKNGENGKNSGNWLKIAVFCLFRFFWLFLAVFPHFWVIFNPLSTFSPFHAALH